MGIAVLPLVAFGSLFASGASSLYMASEAEDAEDAAIAQANEQKRQAKINQRIADIKNVREQRDLIRKTRIQRASVINYGANTGTSTSSGVSGAVSSIGSQLGSNLGYFSAVKEAQSDIFDSQIREAGFVLDQAKHQGNMAGASAIGNLAGNVFMGAGGFKTIFGV